MADFGDIVSNEPRESFFLPPGIVMPYAGVASTPPDGWLFCDGTSHGTATHPNLYAAIGTTYGGSGTAFNVPDLRRRMVLGFGTTSSGTAVGVTGGSFDHTHTGPAHTHDLSNHTHDLSNHTHGIPHTHSLNGHTHGISFRVGPPWGGRRSALFRRPDSQLTPAERTTIDSLTYSDWVVGENGFVDISTGTGGNSDSTGGASINGSQGPSTNISGAPSNNTSGTAGTGNTGSANPPYMTMQYIIKT